MSFGQPNQSPEEAKARVENAIENNELALFMKGNELMPQCGYSKKALGILKLYRDDVEVVDVLPALDTYRVELERRSGWETIPQTFVDGEFIGGSDIVEEMHERGDLADTLGVDPSEVPDASEGTDPSEQSQPDAPF